MEGEFHRETDDSGVGAEAPVWADLETQLKNMEARVYQTRGKEEGEKMKKKIEKKVREAMKKDGLELTDRQNLGGWLKKQLNAAKEIRQEAEDKWNGATCGPKASAGPTKKNVKKRRYGFNISRRKRRGRKQLRG
ncbi:hypothetical protein CHARACLAT_032891 [Characodon lateralis]|uniref:Uncharacterized protein n=1 Tax=Characodon lateralis TaxID=208331 RepID=A0ABU7EPD6_9TELE|nr:hypothetical protein [Characodon lateralis]